MALCCRLCLQILQNDSSNYHEFQNSSSLDSTSLIDRLVDCFPELVLDSIDNNIMCEDCFTKFEVSYAFKTKCVETQHQIYGYLQQMPIGTDLNVYEIAMYYNRLKSVQSDSPLADAEMTSVICNKVSVSTSTDDLWKSLYLDDILSEEDDTPEITKVKEVFPFLETNGVQEQESSSNPNPFNEPATISRIVIAHHECSLCEFDCLSWSGYRVHLILHKGEIPPYKCDECTSFLPDKKRLLEHIAQHTNETVYGCKHCDFATTDQIKYTRHKNSHHKHKYPRQCYECNIKFKSSKELSMHYDEIHTKRKHLVYCRLCKYVCTTLDKLRAHVEHQHVHDYYKNKTEKSSRFKCNFCHTTFGTFGQLKFHLKWHMNCSKDKDTTCRICSLPCETFYKLKLHIKTTHKTNFKKNFHKYYKF